jgi:hypothetical protein
MISLSMTGIKDAFETFNELIVPWRREHAKRKANLENALRQAEIQRLNTETQLSLARAQRERAATQTDSDQAELALSQARKNEAEAKLLLAKADKIAAEAEKERAELRRSQIELAIGLIDKYAPEFSGIQKMEAVIKLLPIMDQLTSSDIVLIDEKNT